MSWHRAARLAAAVIATAAVLGVGPSARASVNGSCEWLTSPSNPVVVRTSPDVQVCIDWRAGVGLVGGVTATVGIFLTPSATGVTQSGSATTVRVGGGVCVRSAVSVIVPRADHAECIHDPSFVLAAGSYSYRDPYTGSGQVAYTTVRPCIDMTSYRGHPGLAGMGVGLACVSTGVDAVAGTNPTGAPTAEIRPGLCLTTSKGWTCVHVIGTTTTGTTKSARVAICAGSNGTTSVCSVDRTVRV